MDPTCCPASNLRRPAFQSSEDLKDNAEETWNLTYIRLFKDHELKISRPFLSDQWVVPTVCLHTVRRITRNQVLLSCLLTYLPIK
jgi:hypothetical protein